MLQTLAKHPCSRDVVAKSFKELKRSIDNLKADSEVNEEDLSTLLMGRLMGMAILLSVGYDVADKENFIFDANGNITDIKEHVRSRNPVCYAYIKQHKWRPNPFTDGGRKRRKTKKRSKKSKKTLRRKTRH